MLDEERESLLVKKRIISKKGEILNQKAYERVQKLIALDSTPEWVSGVYESAFMPNEQRSSFLDECLARKIVDDNYCPYDRDLYSDLLLNWEQSPYKPFRKKELTDFFEEFYKKETSTTPAFIDDDTEVWAPD